VSVIAHNSTAQQTTPIAT